jgi:Lon protease-like protein
MEVVAPVFPLPNLVFFPKTQVPLHIFEPRYREMVGDALAGTRLLAVVLLKPGWEKDYYGSPETYTIGTLGEITEHERLPDGRFNITLAGLRRVRVSAYLPGKAYRLGQLQPHEELKPDPGSSQASKVEERLRALFGELLNRVARAEDERLGLGSGLSLEELVNRLASSLELPVETKQDLLEQDDLLIRGAALAAILNEQLSLWSSLQQFRKLSPSDPRLN